MGQIFLVDFGQLLSCGLTESNQIWRGNTSDRDACFYRGSRDSDHKGRGPSVLQIFLTYIRAHGMRNKQPNFAQ